MSINAVHIEKQMERLVGSGLNNIPPTLAFYRHYRLHWGFAPNIIVITRLSIIL